MDSSETWAQIPQEKMVVYQATARKRQMQHQQQLSQRQERAWVLARQAASLLRERFGVSRVAVFGSLVSSDRLHIRSDVDMAVWELDEKLYYRAVASLLALDREIEIDLVMVEDAPASLRKVIEQEGIIL